MIFRRGFMTSVQATGEFNKLAWQQRKLPNGTPAGDFSLSALHYGNGNPAARVAALLDELHDGINFRFDRNQCAPIF